ERQLLHPQDAADLVAERRDLDLVQAQRHQRTFTPQASPSPVGIIVARKRPERARIACVLRIAATAATHSPAGWSSTTRAKRKALSHSTSPPTRRCSAAHSV